MCVSLHTHTRARARTRTHTHTKPKPTLISRMLPASLECKVTCKLDTNFVYNRRCLSCVTLQFATVPTFPPPYSPPATGSPFFSPRNGFEYSSSWFLTGDIWITMLLAQCPILLTSTLYTAINIPLSCCEWNITQSWHLFSPSAFL
jgi:hypothetical protein